MQRWVIRIGVVVLIGLIQPKPLAYAARAFPTDIEGQMTWSRDGRIEATGYEVEVIGGVENNFWVDMYGQESVGQTFRCDGPVLEKVELGLQMTETIGGGGKGLHYRDQSVPLTVRVRRGGPNGIIVAERTFEPDEVTANLPLRVGVASNPKIIWYYEIRPVHQSFAREKNMINISTYDVYPHGQLMINGKRPLASRSGLADADLNLRVTRSWQVAGDRPGSAIFWAASPFETIDLAPKHTIALMLADDPTHPVELAAARNELVAVQLVVTSAPNHRVKRATLMVDPWQGPKGATIPADQIRIEWLRYNRHYWKGITDHRLYPDPLINTDTAVASKGQPDEPLNTTFWLSMRVPTDIPAGTYRTTARLKVNDKDTLSRALILHVRDFDLPVQTHTRTALFDVLSKGQVDKQAAIQELAHFRIALHSPWHREPLYVLRNEHDFSEAGYEITLGREMQEGLIENARQMNDLGLDVGCITPWGDTYRIANGEADGREGFVRFWRTYYPVLEEHGWVDQAFSRVPDEFDIDELERTRSIVDLFREYAPGVKIMVTDMDAGTNLEKYRRAIGMADIWSQTPKSTGGLSQFFEERLRAGEQVWPYIHNYLYMHSDPLAPRMFFWGLQKHGYQGATLWFMGPRGSYEHTWFGVIRRDDERAGDGGLYYSPIDGGRSGSPPPYTSPDKLWRSARLYRIGYGLDDREYFWMMNDLAQQAKDRGMLSDSLRQRVYNANRLPQRMVWGFVSFTHDIETIDEARKRISEVILELKEVLAQSDRKLIQPSVESSSR